jgi:hypothetical protein
VNCVVGAEQVPTILYTVIATGVQGEPSVQVVGKPQISVA